MDLIARFFLLQNTPPNQLLGSAHDPWLVALSMLVAVITSYVALSLSDRAREAPSALLRLGALAAGTLSLGGGVWTMHFIGMLAFQFCGRVDYDPLWTVGSMLPSLGAAWVALRCLTQAKFSAHKLLLGGVWMGSGIGLMHYGGMAAVRSSAQLRYDPAWFGASIVVAVALSTLALWLHHGLRRQFHVDHRLRTLLAAGILGGAISGMHYTAMGAAHFLGIADAKLNAQEPLHLELALGVAFVALLVSVISVGLNAALVQRQLKRDRLRSEGGLQALVDTAVDGVVRMDGDGVIVAANQAAAIIFGLSQAELSGQALSHLVPALELQGHGFAGVIESDAHRANGQEMRLRVSVGHSEQGGEQQSVAFISDITEAQRRQAELQGVMAAIRRALVVVEFDLQGHVLRANDAFLALTGHTAESLIGQHHHTLCLDTETSSPAYAEHWAALQRGEFRTGDYVRVGRDGRHIWIHATYNPILDAHGKPLRIVKFVNDLTERHVMEQDLREAKARAEQAAAAKSTFLANMSHEIRTPMNAIIGFSEVALEGEQQPDAREHLRVIHRSARSLLGLLNDILDTAKLDHGAVELELQDFSLRQVCADVISTLQMGADRKGLNLSLAVASSVPAFHQGDPLRLQQILLNLVGNAVKFTEQGSVTVGAQRLSTGELEVWVQDTGIGIAPDRIERIFDPFAQADATMTRRFGGTGLGTTIARQLVQLMGGQIGVNSTPGQGSRFWFRLPLADGQAPAPSTPAKVAATLPPLRILAADDVPENLQLLQLKLGAMGHHLTLARDGQEALDCMKAGGFDLALLDVQMPKLDGMQACHLLRDHEAATGLQRLPVIALTASASDTDRSLTDHAGMDGFVVKPIDWARLLGEIARVLGIQPQPASQAGTATARPSAPSEPTTPALPEQVDWAQALGSWDEVALWRTHLRRFLSTTLQAWPSSTPDTALAHRLRGTIASFGLAGLAATCVGLEQRAPLDEPQIEAAWAALHQRLTALQAALTEPEQAHMTPTAPVAWPTDAAATLAQALQRGELPEAIYRQVLIALSGPERERLRDAIDSFDFDQAQALLARHAQELA
jgi:PAS domain S-box-containing protein